MKNQLIISSFIILLLSLLSANSKAQNVNIPDANFKAYLVAETTINTNGDAEIQVSEANAFTGTIFVSSKNITDLTGIESFTTLTGLYCAFNSLTSLNLSANLALTYLDCSFNDISFLNLSVNAALTHLDCSDNFLDSLSTASNPAIEYLICSNNQLSTLDLSANTSLLHLACNNNSLYSLNLSANTALTNLICSYNSLPSLNLDNNTALTYLVCRNNPLYSLNITHNTALTYLSCYYNYLDSLDLSNNTALVYLACGNNSLTSLDVSTNTNLVNLYCNSNQISSLNTSNNPNLKAVYCYSNLFSALDFSNNPLLEQIDCRNAPLYNLNLKNGNNTAIYNFDATFTSLTCIEVDDPVYSTNNWFYIPWGASFSTNCALLNNTAISEEAVLLNAYPNPTNGNFNLDLGKTYNVVSIEVHNTIGQIIFSKNYTAVNQIEMNLAGASGVYFIQVRTEVGESTIQMIKE